MITELVVKDFQSIKKASLAPGKLTTITGPSNAGKSAILRAIQTLLQNSSAARFVTTGAKEAAIGATVDGHTIVIRRGPGVSTYEIDGERYAKVGSSVPAPAAEILNLLEANGDTPSIAGQFDSPFMLSTPSTQVAQTLADVTGATLLLSAGKELNRRRLNTSKELNTLKGLHAEAEQTLTSFANLPQRLQALQQAEALLAQHTELEAKASACELLATHINSAQAALTAFASQPRRDTDASRALLEKAQELTAKLHALEKLWLELQNATGHALTANDNRERAQLRADQARTAHHDLLKELGVCPTCSQKIPA